MLSQMRHPANPFEHRIRLQNRRRHGNADVASSNFHAAKLRMVPRSIALNVAYEVENSVAMINFVTMGCGCSLLLDYVRNIRQDGVVYKTLGAPSMTNTLAIIKRKDASRLADSFLQFAAEKCTTRRPK